MVSVVRVALASSIDGGLVVTPTACSHRFNCKEATSDDDHHLVTRYYIRYPIRDVYVCYVPNVYVVLQAREKVRKNEFQPIPFLYLAISRPCAFLRYYMNTVRIACNILYCSWNTGMSKKLTVVVSAMNCTAAGLRTLMKLPTLVLSSLKVVT